MKLLVVVILIVLVLQIVVYVVTRRKLKKECAQNVLIKYKIKSRRDTWRAMNNSRISEEDRNKIENMYNREAEVS